MKKILPVLFIFLSTTTIAQNKDYLLSLEGIGSLKLEMPVTELEKVLKTKVVLKEINIDTIRLTETINVKYKGINVVIDLIKYQDETIVVNGISTDSPLCKTKSGIGIGSTKLQVISAYEGYYIDATPEYTMAGDTFLKNKTKSSITIKEAEEGNAIVFMLLNNKVVSFAIYPIFDDEEG